MSDLNNQQPAEAVSEAARGAAESEIRQFLSAAEDEHIPVGLFIQRAITAATAAQQSEIAALREENRRLSGDGSLGDFARDPSRCRASLVTTKDERDALRAELATTKQTLEVELPQFHAMLDKWLAQGTDDNPLLPMLEGVTSQLEEAKAELATTREQFTKSEQRLIESAASNANEIAALRSQLQEAKRLNGELKEERDAARYIANQVARDLEIKRQKYGKIDADIRQAIRATGFCEIEGSTVGLIGSICDLATQRVKELAELRAARRKEVRITFDKIEGSFNVTFGRTGQTVKFEKPKHVAGNVENWLANLRHAED